MATISAQTQNSFMDTIKLVFALLLVIAGMAGFYYYQEQSLLYRVLGLLAVIGVAIAIALSSFKGKQLLNFMSGARGEVRKMVWPSRAETIQTTLVVMVMVGILAVFLLIIDSILHWAIASFLG
ncbi:MAG: preprotein translocase subunit SecE [Thiotrichaceae bacterium]|nr:preprotein translocase subunit SecE [Thiotrichaceae bacterium]